MAHHHHGPHDHTHPHTHEPAQSQAATDLTIEDADLSPSELGRRNFLRSAGLLGGAAAASGLTGAQADCHGGVGGGWREQARRGVRLVWPGTTTSTPSSRRTGSSA
jgi:hypothetical protein